MRNLRQHSWMICFLLIVPLIFSCKKKTTEPDVIASFTYKVDTVDFKKVHFTSESQNFASLSWNFGDNTAASSEANPVHTFAAIGEYTVKITATSPAGVVDTYSEKITISDPNAELTKLVGDASKTWKLLRSTITGRYPLECGPEDHSQIWWAMGKDNDELANRPCMLNDEWTFFRDGSFTYDAKGDYWAEGGIFNPSNICAATTSMVGPNGEDLSAWGNGTHTFQLTAGSPGTLKAIGMGAFVGFIKLGNGSETKIPLDHVTYNVIKLTDGPVDTLIVEGVYRWDPAVSGGYWRFVLVHYDDPSQEPPIPGNKPSVNFTTEVSGLTVTFTNTTTGATSYLWDFGDGATSTAQNPVHTYATDGIYTVQLTGTNINGSNSASTLMFLSNTALTQSLLEGTWKIRVEEKSIFVGSGLGKSDWWTCPKANLVSGTGVDDWTCMTDDEFIFSANGNMEFKTMGSTRNDGYFGTPNGCWSDAQILASPGAPFSSAVHTYTFTPATGTSRPIILLTSAATKAAFLGFYKGYYGGENGNDNTKPANGGVGTNKYEVMGYADTGTKKYLFVSVDISADHSGGSAWSVILEK